jgi:Amt family ammonium transporter
MGYKDFAGSGTIHFFGAVGALVLTWSLGARTNRFNAAFVKRFEASNSSYITLATLSLYCAWVFFNAGSALAIQEESIYVVARAAMNTFIGGAAGGIAVFLIFYFR